MFCLLLSAPPITKTIILRSLVLPPSTAYTLGLHLTTVDHITLGKLMLTQPFPKIKVRIKDIRKSNYQLLKILQLRTVTYHEEESKPLNHTKHLQHNKGGGTGENVYMITELTVIINREYKDYINLILKNMVPEQNPCIFGTPGSTQHTHLRAWVLMIHYADAYGAPNPLTLRRTELRKQIDTACALYNLSDPLVEDVANLLRHHIDVQKEIHR
ncbi:hypothetical protein JTB14_000952 [Gonioctena quinquepunctata]|nr:hypothetical protein JTB14_000952 [Gonioctena quinquepunctata]